MKKGLKLTLLIVLGLFGVVSMITPAFRAIVSNSTSKIWTYSLYIRMFGGGNPKVGNTGPLTLAWIFALVALITTVILIILNFLDYEMSKKAQIITYSFILVFYLTAGTLVIFTPQLIGNTASSSLGIGSILTSSSMYGGFIISFILVLYTSIIKE